MKRKLFVVLVLLGAGAGSELLACGNKFLVPSRGTRFGQPPVAREAANILVYARPGSALSETLGDVPIASILAEAGYRPVTVANPSELDEALGRDGWDLVVADLADSAALRDRLGADGAPGFLPVVVQPTREELAGAKTEYGHVLKAPFRGRALLQVVDYTVAIVLRGR